MSIAIVAEIGINHNGDIRQAFELIDMVKDAGADVAKFQYFHPAECAERGTDYFKLLEERRLTEKEMVALRDYCDKIDIEFGVSVFDRISTVEMMFMVTRFVKIPSGKWDLVGVVNTLEQLGGSLVMSNGKNHGEKPPRRCTLLYCVSEYPAPLESIDVELMREADGFSDHTIGNTAAIIAVTCGATMIEKHVTMDSSQPGPDHAMSADPEAFKEYVKAIREAEIVMGKEE